MRIHVKATGGLLDASERISATTPRNKLADATTGITDSCRLVLICPVYGASIMPWFCRGSALFDTCQRLRAWPKTSTLYIRMHAHRIIHLHHSIIVLHVHTNGSIFRTVRQALYKKGSTGMDEYSNMNVHKAFDMVENATIHQVDNWASRTILRQAYACIDTTFNVYVSLDSFNRIVISLQKGA